MEGPAHILIWGAHGGGMTRLFRAIAGRYTARGRSRPLAGGAGQLLELLIANLAPQPIHLGGASLRHPDAALVDVPAALEELVRQARAVALVGPPGGAQTAALRQQLELIYHRRGDALHHRPCFYLQETPGPPGPGLLYGPFDQLDIGPLVQAALSGQGGVVGPVAQDVAPAPVLPVDEAVVPATMAPGTLPPVPRLDDLPKDASSSAIVRHLWQRTLGEDASQLDPGATYRPMAGDAPPLSSAESFGQGQPYSIIEEVGRGGMGVVLRALQSSLQREVAVKKSLPAKGDAKQQRYLRDSFLSESFATGLLDHPNIVPIHNLERGTEGELLLTMKLVSGVSWKDLLHPDEDVPTAPAAEWGLDRHLRTLIAVCNGMAYAHNKGIVHLDLKPENIMIGEYGEVLIMDWGLAHSFREDPGPVRSTATFNQPCGSPSYMAPEMALGQGQQIGPHTDIYLLGAILFEIVTGGAPHAGGGVYVALARAVESVPPDLPPSVPPQLADICRRALAKGPQDRFRSVRDFQRAVEGFLEHEESMRITADAAATLAEAQRLRKAGGESANLYLLFAEAVAGFHQALVLWEGNPEAAEQEEGARRAFAEAALERGDVGLAEAQTADLAGADELKQRIARERSRQALIERRNRLLRWGLLGTVALILGGLLIGFKTVSDATKNEARNYATTVAQLLAMRLQPHADAMERLQSPEDMHRPEYETVYRPVMEVDQGLPSIAYVYVMRPTNEEGTEWAFIIDIDPPGFKLSNPEGEPGVPPGEAYELPHNSVLPQAVKGPIAEEEFITDRWGTFISGYAPVKNAGGEVVAVVGVDIRQADVLARVDAWRTAMYVGTGIILALGLLLVVLRLRQRKQGREQR